MRTGSRPCCQPGAQSSILKECLQFRCSGSGAFCGEGLIPGPETSLAKKKKKRIVCSSTLHPPHLLDVLWVGFLSPILSFL